MKRRLLILWAALGFGPLFAGSSLDIPLQNGSGARIEVESFLDELPSRGYAPLEVTIRNSSGAAREWTFEFTSPAHGFSKDRMLSSERVTIENNSTRTVPLLVPLSPNLSGMPWVPVIQAAARGYKTTTDSQGALTSDSEARTNPFVAVSTRLGSSIWSELKQQMKAGSRSELNGSLFNPKRFPEDWRALSGIDGLWLAAEEFDKLSAAQRDALRTWTQLGGRFILCGANSVPPDFQNACFGKATTGPATLTVGDVRAIISKLDSAPKGFRYLPDTERGFETIKPNVPLLTALVVLFAVIVGPLNIFVFASAGHRHRLFWTTPLISVIASLLVAAFIFFQDGTGGQGTRAALIQILPDEHRQLLIQQQTSRTGPLFGSSFRISDPAVITQVETKSPDSKNRMLENNGTFFAGDWFASRSLQTQKIQSVIPSRSSITLLNAGAVRDQGVAPMVSSSFSSALDELVYVDPQKRLWVGRAVQPGQKVTLSSGNPTFHYPDGIRDRPEFANGAFYAHNRDSSAFMNTLASIRWNDQPVVYFGPVSLP